MNNKQGDKMSRMILVAVLIAGTAAWGQGEYAEMAELPDLMPVSETIQWLTEELNALRRAEGLSPVAEVAPIAMTVSPDVSEVTVGVDMLAGTNAEGDRTEGRFQAITGWMRQHPVKTAGIAAAAIVGFRAAQGELGDDWDKLRGKRTTNTSRGDLSNTEASSALVINTVIEGDGNTVSYTIQNQQPQGSNTSAPPTQNTGSGGMNNNDQ